MNFFSELKRRNVFKIGIMYGLVSWLLLQVISIIAPALLLPEWTLTLVTVLLMTGFPIALIIAWAFEVTPDGLKPTKDVNAEDSVTQITGKKIEYSIIAALLFVVAFLYFKPEGDVGKNPISKGDGRPSIAVLPFEDFSPEKNQEYFSKGIAEEILNLLAKTDSMKVAARTSSFAFYGTEEDIRDIGQKLDVNTVLEGSIRKAGQTLRITAQLINVEDGYHLWSETYDRDISDVFAIQDEISAAILKSLKIQLLGDAGLNKTVKTASVEAYNRYLIARDRMAQQTYDDIKAAKQIFLEVTKQDPDFAPAHVQLVLAAIELESRAEYVESAATYDALKQATDTLAVYHLTRAQELAPDLAELAGAKGLYAYKRFKLEEAEGHFDRAVKLNPNYAKAYMWRGNVRYDQNKYLAMLKDREKAYALDPMSLDISRELAYDYRSFWRPEDASKIIDRMFELRPNHLEAYKAKLLNEGAVGKYTEAVLTGEEALKHYPDEKWIKYYHSYNLIAVGEGGRALELNPVWAPFLIARRSGWDSETVQKLQGHLKGSSRKDFLYDAAIYYRAIKDKNTLKLVLQEMIVNAEEAGFPWQKSCNIYMMESMEYVGMEFDTSQMMAACRKRTQERVQSKFLCPCSWYNLVTFAILDNRYDDAVKRANEWLDYGDFSYDLETDHIFKRLKNHAEYEGLLRRNRDRMAEERRKFLRYKPTIDVFSKK